MNSKIFEWAVIGTKNTWVASGPKIRWAASGLHFFFFFQNVGK